MMLWRQHCSKGEQLEPNSLPGFPDGCWGQALSLCSSLIEFPAGC